MAILEWLGRAPMQKPQIVFHVSVGFVAVVALIALAVGFLVIKTVRDDVLRLTRRTPNAMRPAEITDSLITRQCESSDIT